MIGAIDFGTTYSGYCYSIIEHTTISSNKPRIAPQCPVYHDTVSYKTPTAVLLDGSVCMSGYEAEDKYNEIAESETEDHRQYYDFGPLAMSLPIESFSSRLSQRFRNDGFRLIDNAKVNEQKKKYWRKQFIDLSGFSFRSTNGWSEIPRRWTETTVMIERHHESLSEMDGPTANKKRNNEEEQKLESSFESVIWKDYPFQEVKIEEESTANLKRRREIAEKDNPSLDVKELKEFPSYERTVEEGSTSNLKRRRNKNEKQEPSFESMKTKDFPSSGGQIGKTEEEIRKLEQLLKCKVCLDRDSCIIFFPCRHMATCESCESFLHRCPVCRAPINESVKINEN